MNNNNRQDEQSGRNWDDRRPSRPLPTINNNGNIGAANFFAIRAAELFQTNQPAQATNAGLGGGYQTQPNPQAYQVENAGLGGGYQTQPNPQAYQAENAGLGGGYQTQPNPQAYQAENAGLGGGGQNQDEQPLAQTPIQNPQPPQPQMVQAQGDNPTTLPNQFPINPPYIFNLQLHLREINTPPPMSPLDFPNYLNQGVNHQPIQPANPPTAPTATTFENVERGDANIDSPPPNPRQ